jgi:hypothetical protein
MLEGAGIVVRRISFIGAAASGLLLAGCATPWIRDAPVESVGAQSMPASFPRRPGLAPSERELLRDRPLEWGLALSGGGLRSALFSVGVLKSLYDRGALQQVDIVSTVSGGGYTAYWLFANELAEPGAGRFGRSSLSDERFPGRVCELITKSNFVTYGRLGRVLPFRIGPRSAKLYEKSLLRTFGGADRVKPPIRISEFRAPIEQRVMPYLIMNATIDNPSVQRSWPHKLIEFTPLFFGAGDFGYRPWTEASGGSSLPVRHIASVSGAAFSPLKQEVDVQEPSSGRHPLILWDGGKSENLGAFALIMRGVRNIVVSDAEHDPAYRFPAYQMLRNNLVLYNLTLRIGDIEDHLKPGNKPPYARAVSVGHVTDAAGKPVSTIYYVKASMAEQIAPALAEQMDDDSPGGKAQARFMEDIRRTAERPGGPWRCEQLATSPLQLNIWSAHNAGSYADYLNRRNLKVKLMNAVGDVVWRDVKIGFPQYSTGDQSFFRDQALAFIGLGYLEAEQLPRQP